jgi:murein DD-endopeptidase MepM/ murein hydrolase activator NlpD
LTQGKTIAEVKKMKRHKFTKWNKEKVSLYASALLVVGVCAVSGIYAGSQSPSKKQIIDLESLEEEEQAQNSDEEGEEVTLPVTVSTQSALPADESEGETAQETMPDMTGDVEVAAYPVETVEETADTAVRANAAVLHFDGENGLSWPVIGNVILDYSMEERTYLATLNQYCYYPAIAISATEGTPVNAAAAGRVTKIGVNEEIGQYVIMDLGDGYQATYGQLENLTLEQGDTISKGQIIGYVAAPTKYYSLEGTNLYFQLEQDDNPVNPVGYFK